MDKERVAVMALLLTLLGACASEHVSSPATETLAEHLQVPPTDGRSRTFRMTLPEHPRPWDTDADSLEEAVARAGGIAWIALKMPANQRAFAAEGLRTRLSDGEREVAVSAVRSTGVTVLDVYPSLGLARLRVPRGSAKALRLSPFVDFVEPDAAPVPMADLVTPPAVPAGQSAAAGSAGAGEVVPWNLSFVQADAAWQVTSGASTSIMLMGTGLMPHSDLPTVPSQNCGGYLGSCSAEYANSTFEAGVILARANGFGIRGIASGILASNVYSWRIQAPNGMIYRDMVALGLTEAIAKGVKVVLASYWTPDYWAPEASAFADAFDAGVVSVAPVGHDVGLQSASYPASYSQVLGVAGVRNDSLPAALPVTGCISSSYSNYWGGVNYAAPFWAHTTIPFQGGLSGYWDSRDLLGWCSNGLAAAHVAGIVALIRDYAPYFTPGDVATRMRVSAHYGGFFWEPYTGRGTPLKRLLGAICRQGDGTLCPSHGQNVSSYWITKEM